MIKREMYMIRIRPFIGDELIKVMAGIRRAGKSVMLELIKEEEIDFVCDNVKDNFPKYVVTMDELDMSRNGIKHRNIRDFLTASEWN